MACGVGTFNPAKGGESVEDACQPAPAGSMVNVSGATEYTTCLAGTFQNVTGASACVACLAGSYSNSFA